MFTLESTSALECFVSLSNEIDDGYAYVSDEAWESLLFLSGQNCIASVPRIPVTFTKQGPAYHTVKDASSVLWTRPAKQCKGNCVLVSSKSRFFKSESTPCSLKVTELTKLTEVTVLVSSPNIYAQSISESFQISFEQWLCKDERILKTGETLLGIQSDDRIDDYVKASIHPYVYTQIILLEPVLQGYVILGETRFLVIFQEMLESISASQVDWVQEDTSKSITQDDDDFVIDENFLAPNILQSTGYNSDLSNFDGFSSINAISHSRETRSFTLSPKPSCIIPPKSYNETYSLLISTNALAKVGMFNGDWAIARIAGDSRLVQALALEDADHSVTSVYVDPQFACNYDWNPVYPTSVIAQLSSYGAIPPPIPIAKSAVLARIASPASLKRINYNAMLLALKNHFRNRRLIKMGDIICVSIPTEYGSVLDDIIDNSDVKSSEEEDENCLNDAQFSTSNVYFLITNVEHDVIDTHSDVENATILSSASGELGCWVDPSFTRIIQTGLEHHRVVCTEPGISEGEFTKLKSSTEFNKLFEIASSCLMEKASIMGLCPSILLKGSSGSTMLETARVTAQCLGYHSLEISVYDCLDETEQKTESRLKDQFDTAKACSPCILLLKDIDGLIQATQNDTTKEPSILSYLRDLINELDYNWRQTGFPLLLVATTSNYDRLSATSVSCFKHEIDFEVPDVSRRLGILESLTVDDHLGDDLSLKNLAVQTAAFTDANLIDLVSQARVCAVDRSLQIMESEDSEMLNAVESGILLTSKDVSDALSKVRATFSHNIGAPSIPNVTWDDVGGLAEVKKDILDTVQLPLDDPSLFMNGLRKRSGILLYGPPGTGKTLLAKAVATSCSLNFFSVKGPELLNMYIGESEANVRRVFQRAREAKPCVIFFDELDSVAPKRGNHGDSGGVMDRIVSQLLAELDGMSASKEGSEIFVIGATNRPDLLDPALLRPGRFDRLLYLGVSNTHEAQFNIISALTRKFRLESSLDLMTIAQKCSFNYTGADLYALCSDAMLKAMSRKAQEVDKKIARLNQTKQIPGCQYPLTSQYYLSELASPNETEVILSYADFQEALDGLVPSVSQSEMQHYNRIQKSFSEQSISPANSDLSS